MKRLLFILIGLSINIQNAFTQTPNDNNGSGNCLSFDGVNDKVSFNNQVIPVGAKTISLWLKTSHPGPGALIIMENNAGWTARHGTALMMQANGVARIQSTKGTGGTSRFNVYGNTAINTGEWVNVAFVWDGTTNTNAIKIYIDGVLDGQGTSPATETANASYNLTVGVDAAFNTSFFDGEMDEVRIWNRALTETEIRDNLCGKIVGNETGLVAYWNMNEGTGGTVTDLTVNGNNGTLQ